MPNRVTQETRELVKSAVEVGFSTFAQDLSKLEPIDRLNILAKFLPYVIPKMVEEINIEMTEMKLPNYFRSTANLPEWMKEPEKGVIILPDGSKIEI